VLYVARRYVIDVYTGLCSHSGPREADEDLPMIRRATRRPSKPGRPVANRDGGIYVTVKWSQPEDDGGGDITAYVIKYGAGMNMVRGEHSDVSDEDTNVDDYATVKVDGDTTSFTFTNQLDERKYHQFAVAAVNTAGRGEFSEFSDYIFTSFGK